ncbi:MAG: pantoate--beta-alanine ligase [Candidatus Omnitrophica bacterium]|nr:pantoate--beta-alanine ligase [Candidatus Omnitrophota bacterium]
MRIIHSIGLMQKVSSSGKARGKTIGFVPTMGALHAGHLSLIRAARKHSDLCVVSIFINPSQFGPNEDFKKYPRDLRGDTQLCRKEGVDIIFNPDPGEMYPDDFKTNVYVRQLSGLLCGKSRPGHFAGVATVVAKLFNIVQPDLAYFGQKDAQQAVIIKQMCRDLNFPLKIKIMPTLRNKDGLALSSRNEYLSPKEQGSALALQESLNLAKSCIKKGERNAARVIRLMRGLIRKEKSAKIDYVAIVDPRTLKPLKKITGGYLIALAVRIGKTRLIDNICITH